MISSANCGGHRHHLPWWSKGCPCHLLEEGLLLECDWFHSWCVPWNNTVSWSWYLSMIHGHHVHPHELVNGINAPGIFRRMSKLFSANRASLICSYAVKRLSWQDWKLGINLTALAPTYQPQERTPQDTTIKVKHILLNWFDLNPMRKNNSLLILK